MILWLIALLLGCPPTSIEAQERRGIFICVYDNYALRGISW